MSLENKNNVLDYQDYWKKRLKAELVRIEKILENGGEREAYELAKAMHARLLRERELRTTNNTREAEIINFGKDNTHLLIDRVKRQITGILNDKNIFKTREGKLKDANILVFKYKNRPVIYKILLNFLEQESRRIR
jgi:hypothetical protein